MSDKTPMGGRAVVFGVPSDSYLHGFLWVSGNLPPALNFSQLCLIFLKGNSSFSLLAVPAKFDKTFSYFQINNISNFLSLKLGCSLNNNNVLKFKMHSCEF